jgi:hypothetical protein
MSFTRLKLVSLISLDIGFPGLLRWPLVSLSCWNMN